MPKAPHLRRARAARRAGRAGRGGRRSSSARRSARRRRGRCRCTWISTSRPVGSTPWNGAGCVPREDLARDDLVALGDLVEDRRPEAGERGAEAVELLADALGARGDPGRAAVVDARRGAMSSSNARSSAAGLVLVDEAADDVLGLHGGSSVGRWATPGGSARRRRRASVDLPVLRREQVVLHREQRGGRRGWTRRCARRRPARGARRSAREITRRCGDLRVRQAPARRAAAPRPGARSARPGARRAGSAARARRRRRAPRRTASGSRRPARASAARSSAASLGRARRAVGARLGHRLEGVGGGEHARRRAAIAAAPWPAVVARAVEPLVVHPGQRGERRQRAAARQHPLGVVGVQPHALLLAPAAAARARSQMPFGHGRAPEVVHERRAAQRRPRRRVEPGALARRPPASSATPVEWPWCSGVLRSTASPNARQTRSRPASETRTTGAGSAATAAASGSARVEHAEDRRAPAQSDLGQRGVERRPGAPADRLDRRLRRRRPGGTARAVAATWAIRAGCAIASPRRPRGPPLPSHCS